MRTYLTTEVKVLDVDGHFMGEMHFKAARDLAEEKSLDLVEVGKQDGKSVCKIMDRGKYLYDQKKKQKLRKRHSQSGGFKEVKFGMRIAEHDEDVKINHVRKFLGQGKAVRLVIEMKGRERAHPEYAVKKMGEVLEAISEISRSEGIRRSNNSVSAMIHPNGSTKHAEKSA